MPYPAAQDSNLPKDRAAQRYHFGQRFIYPQKSAFCG